MKKSARLRRTSEIDAAILHAHNTDRLRFLSYNSTVHLSVWAVLILLLNAVQCLGSGDLADGEQAGSRARLAAVPGGVTSGGQPGGAT